MAFTVSKEFMEAFNFCMDWYGVTGEELAYEKQRVRDNYEAAYQCYMNIAEGWEYGTNPWMVKEAA